MNKNNKNLLSKQALLVSLTVKHPSGIKVDKSLREGLESNVGADERTLHVSKHMYGENINKIFRRITNRIRREYYYALTVPWSDSESDSDSTSTSGWRLCPSTKLDLLDEKMQEAKLDFFEEAESFLENYDTFVSVAERKLGSAFNEEDYPDVDKLRSKFVFDFKKELITDITKSSDIRLNVSDKMKASIQQETENRLANNVRNVFKVTVEALLEQVNHIVDKLKNGETFHKTSFEKLKQSIDMLPSINSDILGNDADITNAHQNLVSVFASINSYDSLRDETELGEAKRKKVADDLESSVGDLKGSFFDKAFGGSDD